MSASEDERTIKVSARPDAHLPPVDRAGGGRIAVAFLLATVLFAGAVAGAVLALTTWEAPGVALGLAVLVIVDVAALVTTGAGAAFRLAGVSLLASEDHAPLGWKRLVPPTATWVAVTRGRRDPVLGRLAPPPLAQPGRRPQPASAQPHASRAPGDGAAPLSALPPGFDPAPRAPRGPVRMTVDGQAKHHISGTVIVGRRPRATAEGETTVTVTDLSRTLSKNHVRLELDEDGDFFVTDLGSTNGSVLVAADGTTRPLIPHRAATIEPGMSVMMGDHRLAFTHGGQA